MEANVIKLQSKFCYSLSISLFLSPKTNLVSIVCIHRCLLQRERGIQRPGQGYQIMTTLLDCEAAEEGFQALLNKLRSNTISDWELCFHWPSHRCSRQTLKAVKSALQSLPWLPSSFTFFIFSFIRQSKFCFVFVCWVNCVMFLHSLVWQASLLRLKSRFSDGFPLISR